MHSSVLILISVFFNFFLVASPMESFENGFRSLLTPGKYPAHEQIVSHLTARPSVSDIDERSYNYSGRVNKNPWTGDYWKSVNGGITYRYIDEANNPSQKDYINYYYWVDSQRIPTVNYLHGNGDAVQLLSPAEKYDLLVGDYEFSLTNQILSKHDPKNRSGRIEDWEGICHGWAPASIAEDGAVNSVIATNSRGLKITFFPSDIRALTSQLYAQVQHQSVTAIVGKRCNVDKSKMMSGHYFNKKEYRRFRKSHPECFDTNPGDFHLALINKIGLQKESFIMDATRSGEVWNHPIVGYRFMYSKPKDRRFGYDIEGSIVSAKIARNIKGSGWYKNFWTKVKNALTNRSRKNLRTPGTESLIRVLATVFYVIESPPFMPLDPWTKTLSAGVPFPVDWDSWAYITDKTFEYDLELDSQRKIIGGEWFGNKHNIPDFLWGYNGQPAQTPYDQWVQSGDQSLSSVVAEAQKMIQDTNSGQNLTLAQAASRNYHSPLAKVVRALIKESRVNVPEGQ